MATIDTIRQYFADILQRSGSEVTSAEINSYVSAVDSGALTLAQVRVALIQSPEGQDVQDVVRLYQTVFGRVPDKKGLNDQVDTLRGPATEADLANSFANSPEFITRFGGNTVNTAFINAVYQQVLGRTPSAGEVKFYMESGFSAGRIALAFSESPEFQANTSTAVVGFLDAAGQGTAVYTGSLGGTTVNVGTTVTLTPNTDTPGAVSPAANTQGTTQNDTFNAILINNEAAAAATGSTLQVSDLINGGAGIDTLSLTVTGTNASGNALAQSLPVTTSVEQVSVRNLSTGADAGVTINAGLAEGLTSVANSASTAAVAYTNVNSNATVSVADTIAATSVQFADKVFQAGGTASISVKNAGTAASDAAITLATTGTAGAATTLAIAAEGKNFINLVDGVNDIAAAGGIKTVTVSGSGSLDLDANSKLTNTTLAADVTKFDASANTGGVTATFANTKVAVTGSSGADKITVAGALVEGASVSLGAGNDSLLSNGGAIGSKVTVDGGAGIDAITTAVINAGNGSQFTNFERLDLANNTLDAALLTGSTITDLVLSGTGGGTINNVKAGVGLLVTASSAGETINVVNATKAANTSDVFNVTFAADAVTGAAPTTANVTAGTIALAGVETVNIASGGGANTWNSLTLTDDAAKAVNITGSQNVNLTVTNQALVGAATDQALASIDASAATGKVSITAGADFDGTIKLGSNDDTAIVLNDATVTTGVGKDTVNVVGATGLDEIVTITDFTVKTDKITFEDKGTETFNSTKVDVGAATTLTEALNTASAGNGGTNGIVNWFQYAGDTYIVEDVSAGATFAATDHAVKLTGLVDLSTATLADFNFA